MRRSAELVKASEGRALILLSTWKALKRFKEKFQKFVGPTSPLKFQGDAGSGQLIEWLKKTPAAVLVATRGFWEGVDVPGEALSLVVIDKVPFAPPNDPVMKKRVELCERAGGNGFVEVSLPQAQMALQQGSGRLIRTHADRGVIAVLDSRLYGKSWGRRMLACFPEGAPVTAAVEDVGTFFSTSEVA
jgi:ATP-dependent DNA helicase DinG